MDEEIAKYHGSTEIPTTSGVYIVDTDNKFYSTDSWDTANNDKVVGVAAIIRNDYVLVNGVKVNYKYLIALNDISTGAKWAADKTTLVSDVVTFTSSSDAHYDYAGEANTAAWIANYGAGNTYAAQLCNNFIFPNGKKGYLPALGELKMIKYALYEYQGVSALNEALQLCGGTPFQDQKYWSSTQYSEANAWSLGMGSTYSAAYGSKTNGKYVRPFASLD